MALYDELADVYRWLVPDELLTPEGSAAAFAGVLGGVPAGACVLDCAAGTGELAVGLALRGFAVTATDASTEMLLRARALAAARGAEVEIVPSTWEELAGRGWEERFDAVLCVGNSLTHAAGRPARRAALAAMAGVLRPGGVLAVTSRDWERLRAAGSRLEVGERLVERPGGRGVVIRHWSIPAAWDEPHALDVAVAVVGDDGTVTTRGERMPFWPFRRAELEADLRAAGLVPGADGDPPGAAERYLVRARRMSGAPPG